MGAKKPMSTSDTLIFYEKPGCINNRKQAIVLDEAGFRLERRSLLTYDFTPDILRGFFGPLPRSRWLNPTAPAIKQGKIQPDQLTDDELLHAMCSDPLLIRRPLVQQGIKKWVGFDWDTLRGELGVDTDQESKLAGQDLETCARTKS